MYLVGLHIYYFTLGFLQFQILANTLHKAVRTDVFYTVACCVLKHAENGDSFFYTAVLSTPRHGLAAYSETVMPLFLLFNFS